MKLKDCNFKIIEGPDEQGRVRMQCESCGRLWPSKKRSPRAIASNERIVGIACNPLRRQQRLAATRAQFSDQRGKSCPENCINRAAAAQAALAAELNAALMKAKEHELQSVLKRMLEHAQRNEINPELFRAAQGLAVKQALADGRQHTETSVNSSAVKDEKNSVAG